MPITKKVIAIIFFLLLLFSSHSALADCSGQSTVNSDGTITICNPLGDKDMKPSALIGQIIKGVLGIVGSLALVMFIYGGFTWMTAAGASDKVTKGRDIIVWAVVGLIIIFSAYAAVNFVFKNVLGTGSETTRDINPPTFLV